MKVETQTEDWKQKISDLFKAKKIYRLEYLNKRLQDDTKTWIDQLKNYDGVEIKSEIQYSEFGMNNPGIQLTIKVRSQVAEYSPFIVIMGYCPNDDYTDIILRIKSTKRINLSAIFESNSKFDDRNNHVFTEEELYGEEIHDPIFIYSKLFLLLKKWMNNVDRSI